MCVKTQPCSLPATTAFGLLESTLWGWDAPFFLAKEQYAKDGDALKVWQGHWAGIEQPYCHMEKLLNLEKLPAHGFMVSCFPWKIKDASGGFVRAVAMFD